MPTDLKKTADQFYEYMEKQPNDQRPVFERIQWFFALEVAVTLRDCNLREMAELAENGLPAISVKSMEDLYAYIENEYGLWNDPDELLIDHLVDGARIHGWE